MKSTIAIVASILAVFAAFLLVNNDAQLKKRKEGFESLYTTGPEWFHKLAYDPNQWIVSYNPDQLSKPGGCDMHYRGNPEELNYLSSAYRFWRM